MKRLIILRHGKAAANASTGEDFDRPLVERGEIEAAAMGRLLAEKGLVPDLALVSPAARTKGTWEAAQPSFPNARAEFPRTLYNADARLVRGLAEVADAEVILVIGHNPGLQELVARLMSDAGAPADQVLRARTHFPTATAAAFSFGEAGVTFEGLFYPGGRG